MNKNKAIESVNEIKELMERSSKFVSLSGMTAVLAGVYALAGAYVAGQLLSCLLYTSPSPRDTR